MSASVWFRNCPRIVPPDYDCDQDLLSGSTCDYSSPAATLPPFVWWGLGVVAAAVGLYVLAQIFRDDRRREPGTPSIVDEIRSSLQFAVLIWIVLPFVLLLGPPVIGLLFVGGTGKEWFYRVSWLPGLVVIVELARRARRKSVLRGAETRRLREQSEDELSVVADQIERKRMARQRQDQARQRREQLVHERAERGPAEAANDGVQSQSEEWRDGQ